MEESGCSNADICWKGVVKHAWLHGRAFAGLMSAKKTLDVHSPAAISLGRAFLRPACVKLGSRPRIFDIPS